MTAKAAKVLVGVLLAAMMQAMTWHAGVLGVHENDEDVLANLETRQLFEDISPNEDRPDRFLYGRTIFGIGPFHLSAKRETHYSNVFDSSIPLTLPTLRGDGPAFLTRLVVRLKQSVDFATGVRRDWPPDVPVPVKLKSFMISKYHHASPFCSERLMPLVELTEMEGFAINIPLPYGIGFGGGRPSADRFPHDWEVLIRIEDIRSAVGVDYPLGADEVMIEYQAIWTEDPQMRDAHVTLADALGCAEEDTRYSLELGPAHQHHFTDVTH